MFFLTSFALSCELQKLIKVFAIFTLTFSFTISWETYTEHIIYMVQLGICSCMHTWDVMWIHSRVCCISNKIFPGIFTRGDLWYRQGQRCTWAFACNRIIANQRRMAPTSPVSIYPGVNNRERNGSYKHKIIWGYLTLTVIWDHCLDYHVIYTHSIPIGWMLYSHSTREIYHLSQFKWHKLAFTTHAVVNI